MGLFLAFHTLVDNYLLGRPDALATGAAIFGFSVAFGSIGCSSSAGGLQQLAPLAQTLSAGGTNS